MGAVDDALGTNIFGDNSTDRAIDAQTRGTNQANQYLKDQYQRGNNELTTAYNTQNSLADPYNKEGYNALSQLASGDFAKNLEMDPGYQFRLKQGQNALRGGASAQGNLHSGATMKALERYGQDYASNEYNNAYNRNYQRLSQLAGLGFNANQNLMNAAGNYGSSMNQNMTGLGNAVSGNITGLANANASAQIAQANRTTGLIGDGIGAAAMYFSDVRLKENIVPMSKENIEEMKQHLKAFSFNYKSEEHGQGDWVGVMAQDLEKSKLGRTLVIHDSQGNKQIDLRKVLSMFLATMAEA